MSGLPLDGITVVGLEQAVAAPVAPRQLTARDRWRTIATPARSVQALLPPATVAGREPATGAVPALGAHSASLRAELAQSQEASHD